MSKGWFEAFIASAYVLIFIGAGFFLSWMTIQRKKNMDGMKDNIRQKIAASIPLSAKDVVYIGRGFSLSPASSRSVVYRLFSAVSDAKDYQSLKDLIVEIEKEEPFEDLPDEVKPSLSRLTKIIESTSDESDKHVLLPITSTLNKYVELRAEQEKFKKQNTRAYVISIVSFVVGAVSFYFTLKSPGEPEIRHAVEQALASTLVPPNLPGKNVLPK